jgi:tetratricopeptide (TPR) repeat protein
MRLVFSIFRVLLLLLLPVSVIAQDKRLDSLFTGLEASSGKERLRILNTLAFELSYTDQARAAAYAREALGLSQELGDKQEQAIAHLNLGHVSFDKADYQEALDSYLAALRLSEALKDEKRITNAVVCIGNVYLLLDQYDKSLDYYSRALPYYKKVNDHENLGVVLSNIGVLHLQKGDHKKALDYLFKAIAIDSLLGNERSLSNSLSNIGTSYRELGNYKEALACLNKAYELKEKLHDRSDATILNIAGVHARLGNKQKAFEYYHRALELAEQSGDKTIIKLAYDEMADLYKQHGDYLLALEYKEKFIAVKDSIFNSENARMIEEMEKKYNSEKQQQEIALLTKSKEQERMIMNFLSGGVVMVLILAGLIYNRYRIKQKANLVLSQQKQEIEAKNGQLSRAYYEIEQKSRLLESRNRDITDSIRYAHRLQEATLPIDSFKKVFGTNGFILYKPKDIVAGDFYWLEQANDVLLFAAADCTGHGVPGAMVSVVCSNALNRAVKEFGITDPGKILDKTRELVIETFEKSQSEVKDGMDISLCALHINERRLLWAGANNPLWIVRGGELIEVKPDKQPIGKYADPRPFTTHAIDLREGDAIYVFTDGYADQFGGEKGKKFKYSQLKELLTGIQAQPMNRQEAILDEAFEKWRGPLEQVDDVCIMGAKV